VTAWQDLLHVPADPGGADRGRAGRGHLARPWHRADCLFYVLTLGLIALVVNGLLLWLASWVAGKLSLPFHITGFWAAFWGAIIVSVVGWLIGVLVPDRLDELQQ
jgi:hypothetical protein